MTPNGVTCKNYIGIIDGKYYVMPNIIHVPAGLKEGIEIEPYEPHGEDLVDPDDVIGPIEIKPYDPYGENTTDPDDVIPSIA